MIMCYMFVYRHVYAVYRFLLFDFVLVFVLVLVFVFVFVLFVSIASR